MVPEKKESVLETRVREMVKNETRYGIFMAIRTYGSLNIKRLAEILGKTESTIFHHITEMLKEPKILGIDLNKTEQNRGKFYRLTEELVRIYVKNEETVFETDIPKAIGKLDNLSNEELAEHLLNAVKNHPDLGRVADAAKRALSYEHIIENLILNNYQQLEKALLNGLVPARKDFPAGGFSNISIDIKMSNLKQMLLISEAIIDFFQELIKLKKQFQEEIDNSEISEDRLVTEHLHVFSGQLGEFTFIKEEKID